MLRSLVMGNGGGGVHRPILGVLLALILCATATLWWRSKEHEDVFVVVRGHPVSWSILHKQMMTGGAGSTGGGSDAEKKKSSHGEGKHNNDQPGVVERIGPIDHIYVVHFEGEPERKKLLEATLTDHMGLVPGYFEFR